jgi:hypothetical protein
MSVNRKVKEQWSTGGALRIAEAIAHPGELGGVEVRRSKMASQR